MLSVVPPVAFFGPSGTFTEEALLSQPDLAAGERVALASIPDVLAAVERGEHELGVVPIENSIEGSVSVTLDTLVFEHELLIQREVDLPISLNLFVKPGTTLRRRHDRALVPARDRAVPGVAEQEAARRHDRRRELDRRGRAAGVPVEAARPGRDRQQPRGQHLRPEAARGRDRGPPGEPDPVRGRRAGHPGTDRPRQDEHRLLPAQRPPGLAARDPPGVRGALAEPHQAREPADQAEPRRLLLPHRLRGPRRRRARRRLPAHARRRSRRR